MDHNLEDSLNLESMDFDHSEDVVNQEDIPLENSGRLDSITMDMDDVGDQSHPLMESVSDEVIVSDLIEDPFPFQEYILQSNAASSHNIMVDPHQLNRLTEKPDPGVSLQCTDTKPATSNVVAVKVAQPKPTKRLVATAPPREVAIAPKPPRPKPVQYAIAPKPVALVPNKQTAGTINKIPISSTGNVKGNAVLTQFKKQLVMMPKKIKLMSSSQAEGVINTASPGIQYQVACTSEQAQLIANPKGTKPLLKFIQIQGQSGADKSQVLTNVPRARYVMQQKTVPITKIVQGPILAGKKKIITIKPQNPTMQTSQGNVTTKKVVISNSNQKVLIKPNASTSTTQVIKDSARTEQRTQFHPINVPGKGIQYIKLVTNQPQKAKVNVPSKNFVFTDSKGNIIQMTAEKVLSGQSSSIVVPGTITAGGKVVKTVKTQKKLVRIAPVSKPVNPQPARSSQSLLAPMTSTTAIPSSAPMTSLSLPSLSSPVPSPSENAVSIEEFNDMVEQNKEKSVQQTFSLSNYMDNSTYSDATDFSIENAFSSATEDYSTANEYSTIEDSQLHDETVEESIDPDESIDVKPTLQSLISDAVSEERESDNEVDNVHHEVEVGFEKKRNFIRNASFMLQDDIEHNMSNPNQESIIIVPGSNYTERINDSMYSDDSQTYRNRAYYEEEDKKRVPLLSVEAECLPYNEDTDTLPESPPPDPDASSIAMRPRKACNCTKSQCLKLYCDCFANGEFCNNCNCKKCHNNLENEEIRQKAIRSCLERNPNAFRPKIGKSKTGGPEIIRRHTKGCNCKRSGCLKNYCECYEAKIACTAMCKCVGCRNVEETLVRRRDAIRLREKLNDPAFRPASSVGPAKQPCSFMTTEVIEAVCQCLVAAAGERDAVDPVHDVIDEFARCLQDVISASHHAL